MKLTPFTLGVFPSARSTRAVPTALCAISFQGRSPIGKRHNVTATEPEAVVEGSSQEAVRQSNGRCKISQYVGPNPTALSVSRSVLRAIERASSSGRALGHESSAAILTAVADTKLINNRPFGAGYAPGGRLLQGRAARLARRVHTAKVTGSNPVSATKRKVA